MQTRPSSLPHFPRLFAAALLLICSSPASQALQPTAANNAFDLYTQTLEHRLGIQHASPNSTLVQMAPEASARLRRGELIVNAVGEIPFPEASPETGAMLQHWRGTAFVASGTSQTFEHLLRDIPDYSRYFGPQVLRARLLTAIDNRMQVDMRVRQQHVLTVTLDSAYDILFGPGDRSQGWSTSRSSRIAEIADADTPREHALSKNEEHGFLYRLNTYWSWEERDGGLYVQIETVSLSRAIPQGLGWALKPYVRSVPRDSLTFTLRAACDALRRNNN